jgi:MFS family permease
MGIYLSGTQIAPAIGPVIVGVIITFQTWRVAFWLQTALAGLGLVLVVLFLPETFQHQLGVRRANGEKARWIWYNPLRPIMLLKYPNLLLTVILPPIAGANFQGVASGTLLFSQYTLLTPIRYVLDPRFNLTTPLQAGLFYLAPGFGYLCGTFLGGRYSDNVVRRWIVKRNNKRIPEDRLRAGLLPFFTLLPGTVLIYGWCVDEGKGGIALPVIAMFLNAFGQLVVFPSVNTYCTGMALLEIESNWSRSDATEER